MPTVVDLRHCQHVDVGASWLLGNALAHFRGSEHLTVQVPDPGKFSGDWFLHFTRTGLGHAIAKHASVILGPHEPVTAQVRVYYGREGEWLARNFGFVDDLHRGALDPDDEVRFATTLEGFFAKAGYHIALLDGTRQLTPLGRFLFESVQNVYVTDPAVAAAFTECDYLFLAADSMQARLVLIPAWKLQEEVHTPTERRAQRYVDDDDVAAPSVITLNAITAAHAANDFLFSATGLTYSDAVTDYRRFLGRARDVRFDEPQALSSCLDCGSSEFSRLGRGDSADLPTKGTTSTMIGMAPLAGQPRRPAGPLATLELERLALLAVGWPFGSHQGPPLAEPAS